MASSLAPLERLSLEIWEKIGFYTLISPETFLGPPSGLCPLSLVSSTITDKLSVTNNSRLYARLFRSKFDTIATRRRLSQRWLTTRCLAAELIKRCEAMKRICSKDFCVDDLWTIYLMLSESDGKNHAQLFDWANLHDYVDFLITHRAHIRSPLAWYQDDTIDALVVWIMWMTTSRERIRSESLDHRDLVFNILRGFIIIGFRLPTTYAPDSSFSVPLASSDALETAYGSSPPPVSEIMHYSHKLKIAAPPVTAAATLSFTIRAEAAQDVSAFRTSATLPANRQIAISLGLTGPTLEDVHYFHHQNRIQSMDKPPLTLNFDFDEPSDDQSDDSDLDEVVEFTSESFSTRYDSDWYKMVSCYDPLNGNLPLRGPVYKVGSLSGSWNGRLLLPDHPRIVSLSTGGQSNPAAVVIHHKPLYWKLQEHHCLHPDEPLLPGIDDMDGDDFLNAWLPQGITVTHLEDAIEVQDPRISQTSRYETDMAPYSKSACEKLQTPWISDSPDEEIAEVPKADHDIDVDLSTNIDDDDVYADTVSHHSSGVVDILITGETGERHADAWGYYTIIGRIRPWDGLIVLLRTPRDLQQHFLGTWVFKGYLHDQNLVGRWRETSTPANIVGYEGGFVVRKISDT
ncbi:hypothetical protein K443DRAFT_131626 [Laccaria amethystina LaAM-08-1]|uniref:Uncharacterized protein n=1 Tax=Laccaria amethystina LaAM-08-1 TaxID=1095629 RepID=A0A0C9XZ96_9AGAR|nr:hypothetical protein K443DRAFT_131626 [Laccaria amethystina LaAM-08-1]